MIYCNGINNGSGTIGIPGLARLFDSTAPITIGSSLLTSATNANTLNIDELRISQGVRYTGNFTPPTAAYTAD